MQQGNPNLPLPELSDIARRLRREILQMIAAANSGHPGGSLSAIDIISALYLRVMHHDPANPHWEDRDRFILSKGHAAPALYAVLAECGYIPVEELNTLRKLGGRLQGHPERKLPGVEMTGGSLGQGLSYGVGMALAGRLDKKDYKVYVLLGDGESEEGQVWEAAMAAAHFKLNNLIAIVDKNGIQLDGCTADIMSSEPLADKWRGFCWQVTEIDGHNFDQLIQAFEKVKNAQGGPSVILASTVKGKGVSFMENSADWHGKAPNAAQLEQALKELA